MNTLIQNERKQTTNKTQTHKYRQDILCESILGCTKCFPFKVGRKKTTKQTNQIKQTKVIRTERKNYLCIF